jgi:pimeloyl-ACP methyl ester carboxylesterase
VKILKIFGITILVLIAIIVLFLVGLKINHESKLSNEAIQYPPPGKVLDVNGKLMHVYAEGEGDLTLVFMAGHGTSNPTLDFKPIWMRMVDDYRIAVVERSGYGWSETSNTPRDLDTMLAETRKALELAGEKAPFVLVPHSMSGLEAIYWAQKYPDEIKAIVGLDPLIPESYKVMPKPDKNQLLPMFVISRLGLSRYMPETDLVRNFPLMASDDLTEEDKQNYLAVFYKSAFSTDMLREIDYLNDNVETVAKNEVPINTPMYFFISDAQELIANGWNESSIDYLSTIKFGNYMQLSTGHYVHYDKADLIAKEVKEFLEYIK